MPGTALGQWMAVENEVKFSHHRIYGLFSGKTGRENFMKRATITISITPGMKQFVLRRAADEFASVSDYFRELVQRDNYFQRQVTKYRNRDKERNSRELRASIGKEPSARP